MDGALVITNTEWYIGFHHNHVIVIRTISNDRKTQIGFKLILQTHKVFLGKLLYKM